MNPDQPSNSARIVVTVHGIRTTGRWQKEFGKHLHRAGFTHEPLDFGFFKAVALLMPWARSRKIEWFHRQLDSITRGGELVPSVVAHSFGTYLVAEALRKYDTLKLDRVILCGSIVRRDFPWTLVLTSRKQATAVLNECGAKDVWASLIEWLAADTGASGVHGFNDDASKQVIEIKHAMHAHSDFFYDANYRRRWIPFLLGETVQPVPSASVSSKNLRFLFVLVLLGLCATAVAILLLGPERRSSDAAGTVPPIAAGAGSAAAPARPTSASSALANTSGLETPSRPAEADLRQPSAAASSDIASSPQGPLDADTQNTDSTSQVADDSTADDPEVTTEESPLQEFTGNWTSTREWDPSQFGYFISSHRCNVRAVETTKLLLSDISEHSLSGSWVSTARIDITFDDSIDDPYDLERISCLNTRDKATSSRSHNMQFEYQFQMSASGEHRYARVEPLFCNLDGIPCRTERIIPLGDVVDVGPGRFKTGGFLFERGNGR